MKASFILNLNDGTTIDWSRIGREESAPQAGVPSREREVLA
jgi:hypothetical protein